ncbi:hypothetical protein F0562_025423 [Nyssa sinensis]|uniref:Uncharacterized protein n=1 Tax=Nyssa sinensis TaxID=561372 RepID=A0A5J5BGS2_9ASTE|nr:hypothetical protein F0562_025423 [Nyssa sinensis]
MLQAPTQDKFTLATHPLKDSKIPQLRFENIAGNFEKGQLTPPTHSEGKKMTMPECTKASKSIEALAKLHSPDHDGQLDKADLRTESSALVSSDNNRGGFRGGHSVGHGSGLRSPHGSAGHRT